MLDDFKSEPNQFKNELDSEEAIKKYYSNYYSQLRTNETKFPVDKYATTIIDLLGKMKLGNNNTKEQMEKKFGQDYHKLFYSGKSVWGHIQWL